MWRKIKKDQIEYFVMNCFYLTAAREIYIKIYHKHCFFLFFDFTWVKNFLRIHKCFHGF